MKKKYLLLIFSLTICYIAAFIGSVFTTPSIFTWYASLQKPFFNPPNWIFGPVWSILYTAMGYALYLVLIKTTKKDKQYAIKSFALQLILNTLWSIVFFGLHFPGIALIVIILLWGAIFLTIRQFYPLSKIASYLLIPYLFWVSFAILLNLGILMLN